MVMTRLVCMAYQPSVNGNFFLTSNRYQPQATSQSNKAQVTFALDRYGG
jgi:hypothetical protein